MTGMSFGKLTVTGKAESRRHGNATVAYWTCRCVCESVSELRGVDLRRGYTHPCACPPEEIAPEPPAKPAPVSPAPSVAAAVEVAEAAPAHPRPPHAVRSLTAGERASMVEAFRVSGFTQAEAEEMAGLGTKTAERKVG